MVNLKTVAELISKRNLWEKPLKKFSELDMISLSEAFEQAADEQVMFEYVLQDIRDGGPYFKLWPKIKGYMERTFTTAEFHKLYLAHKLREANHKH
jgi:hypothetical protein